MKKKKKKSFFLQGDLYADLALWAPWGLCLERLPEPGSLRIWDSRVVETQALAQPQRISLWESLSLPWPPFPFSWDYWVKILKSHTNLFPLRQHEMKYVNFFFP